MSDLTENFPPDFPGPDHAAPPAKIKVGIHRAWADLAPKLLAFLTGGTAGTTIVFILSRYFGVEIEPDVAAGIVTILAVVLGYFTRDNVKIDARNVDIDAGGVPVITSIR